MCSDELDRSKLTEEEHEILKVFHERRKKFNADIAVNALSIYTCPGCGFPTLDSRGDYLICDVCNWEDDNQDDANADEVWGGPNYELSLTENRIHIGKKLCALAKSKNGYINDDINEVLAILKQHRKRVEYINNTIPFGATLEYKGFKEWEKATEELLNALIKSF